MEIKVEKERQLMDTLQGSHLDEAGHLPKKDGEVKQPETMYDAVSTQGDTLYISDDGRNMDSEKSSLKNDQSETDGKVVVKPAEESLSEPDDIATINLARYTQLELRQMYLDGDITKSEYDEEMDNREMEI